MVVAPVESSHVAMAGIRDALPFVRLLGPPEVVVAGSSFPLRGERSHWLLAYLACSRTWVGRDRLADLFWPDRENSAARSNLRNVLFTTRSLPFCAGLQIDSQGVRWEVENDVQHLRRAVAEQRWGEALGFCRGPLLDGLDPVPGAVEWLAAERAATLALWRTAVIEAAAAGLSEAVESARRLLAVDPYDELVLLAVARLQDQHGQPTEAMRLCREYAERVRSELGVEPSEQVRAYLDPPHHASRPLPVRGEITRFFGRSEELAQIEELLREPDCRLLTVVGSGGSGKTRLARRAAERAHDRWVWVSLESIGAPDRVADAIADSLGLKLRDAASAPEMLAAALRHGRRLVVLDNFEHLMAAAPLVTTLLQRCPQLRVLATSRVRLGVDGEWLLPVEGFACATNASDDGDAECFFVRSAKRMLPGFALTPGNRELVHRLATLLAGNPLALELAASWVRVLPLAEIVSELQRDISLLATVACSGTDRHESMRASFEHSWRLLSERERAALARVAVFRGGFTRDAALQVAEVPLPVLASLLDKSLLRYEPTGRYDRHPLIHQFTRDKLAEEPELQQQMRRRHSDYFARLLQEQSGLPIPRRQRISRLRIEWENIVLATAWLAENGQWEALADCSSTISRDPSVFGNLDVGAAWGGRMLELIERSPTAPLSLVAQIQSDRLWLQIFLELPRRAAELARAALQTSRDAGNTGAEVQVLRSLGHLARRATRNLDARDYFLQALQRAQEAGMLRQQAMLLDALAMVENRTGEYESAFGHAHEALSINERIGSVEQQMYNHYNLGESRVLAGCPAQGLPSLMQCVALAREIDFEQFLTYALVALGYCQLQIGDQEQARASATEARAEALRLDDQTAAGLARLVLARGALQQAELRSAQDEIRAALEEAVRLDDGLVQAAAIPVAARYRLAAYPRSDEAVRWLRWIAARPEVSFDGAREAAELLKALGATASGLPETSPVPQLAGIARDILQLIRTQSNAIE